MAFRVIIEAMQNNPTLKVDFTNKVKLLEWGLNSDNRKRLYHKVKNASFL